MLLDFYSEFFGNFLVPSGPRVRRFVLLLTRSLGFLSFAFPWFLSFSLSLLFLSLLFLFVFVLFPVDSRSWLLFLNLAQDWLVGNLFSVQYSVLEVDW